MGSAIGLWVALAVAAPVNAAPAKLASLRPINLNLPPTPPAPPQQQPAWSHFQAPLPKAPPSPAWVRALFGDPNKPTSSGTRGVHGGSHGFGHGFGHGGGCHGGGHR